MKLILLSFVSLLIFALVKAQDHRLELGLEGGPNQSGMIGKRLPEYAGQSENYCFGFTAQYNINDYFSVKGSLDNELKGYSQSYSSVINPKSAMPIATYTTYTGLQYITAPIMLKFKIGNKIRFFVNSGPYFGIRVGTPASIIYNDSAGKIQSYSGNAKGPFNTLDAGVSAGMGIEIPFSSVLIFDLEGRINTGFVNIDNGGLYNMQNQSLNFLLGFRYKI